MTCTLGLVFFYWQEVQRTAIRHQVAAVTTTTQKTVDKLGTIGR